MKCFVLGALASGLLLFGMSIIYGATGSISPGGIRPHWAKANPTAVAFGLIFIAAGVSFKLGVVPSTCGYRRLQRCADGHHAVPRHRAESRNLCAGVPSVRWRPDAQRRATGR